MEIVVNVEMIGPGYACIELAQLAPSVTVTGTEANSLGESCSATMAG